MKLFGSSHNGGAHTKAAHSAAREEREILVSEIRSDPGGAKQPGNATPPAPEEKGVRKPPAPAGKATDKKSTVRRVLLIIAAVILAFLAFTAIHFLVAGHFFWETPLKVPDSSAASGKSGAVKPPVNTQRPGQGPEDSEAEPLESEPPEDGDDDDADALHIAADAPLQA